MSNKFYNVEKGITRYESISYNGFRTSIRSRMFLVQGYWGDSEWGGKEKALERARACLTELRELFRNADKKPCVYEKRFSRTKYCKRHSEETKEAALAILDKFKDPIFSMESQGQG